MSISNYVNAIYADADIATEGFNTRFKEKIKAIIQKVKDFLRDAWNWIRTQIYNFFKIDAININKDLYYDAVKVLKRLKSVTITITQEFGATITDNAVPEGDPIAKYRHIQDIISEVSDSNEYRRLTDNDYNDNKIIVVRTGDLKSETGSLEKDFDMLKKNMESIDNEFMERNDITDDETINLTYKYNKLRTLLVITKMKITVISKIISNGKPIRKE